VVTGGVVCGATWHDGAGVVRPITEASGRRGRELAMQGLNALYGAIQLFAVLSLPVAVVAAFVARRRHRGLSTPQRRRFVALDLALALTLLGIASVTLLPVADYHRGLEWGLQLRPFASIHQQLTSAISASVAVRIVGFNILLFVPLGFVLRLRPLGWTPTMIGVAATSVSIEVLQAILPLGRTTNVDDVLLNVLGGIVGAAVASRALGMGRAGRAPRISRA
jgi:glycopeptide antibiotics resistance protein